jgi:hypothetical protein
MLTFASMGPQHLNCGKRRLCVSLRFLYNRCMVFDPANPPIWLGKLHVSAAQISAADYAPTPEQGIVECCRLSDAMQRWSKACRPGTGTVAPPVPSSLRQPLPPHFTDRPTRRRVARGRCRPLATTRSPITFSPLSQHFHHRARIASSARWPSMRGPSSCHQRY